MRPMIKYPEKPKITVQCEKRRQSNVARVDMHAGKVDSLVLRRPIRLHKNAPTKTPGSAITPRRSCHSAVLRMSSSPLTLTMDEMMVPEKTPFCAMDARAYQLVQQDGYKSRSGCFSTHREGDLFFGGKGTASVPFQRQDFGRSKC